MKHRWLRLLITDAPAGAAQRSERFPVRGGSGRSATPVSDAFSAVLCTQTLKHLPELEPTLAEFHRVLGTRGMLTFTVTHPEMVWDGYEMREEPDFILSRESDIFHHTSSAYRAALRATGFDLVEWRDIRVGTSIRPYLTESSYEVVQGRPQVLLVSARKGATVAS